MTKASEAHRKNLLPFAGGDKAEVSASQESDNLFTQFWEFGTGIFGHNI